MTDQVNAPEQNELNASQADVQAEATTAAQPGTLPTDSQGSASETPAVETPIAKGAAAEIATEAPQAIEATTAPGDASNATPEPAVPASVEPITEQSATAPVSAEVSTELPSEQNATTPEGAEASTKEAPQAEPEPQTPKISDEELKVLWDELAAKKQANESAEFEVVSKNRGGIVCSYNGLEVFIPMSHWSLNRNANDADDANVGDTVTANVLEMTQFDTDARRVTASRRSILRKTLLSTLEPGVRTTGRVSSILDFGVFVDLGGIDGLLHISELSHIRGRQPGDIVKKGDEIEVVIREIDRDRKRISLGRKELLSSPWAGSAEKYPAESIQKGKVVGFSSAGAFIEMEPGVDGFVRMREISWTRRINKPQDVVSKGEVVEVKVLEIDEAKERMSLSLRQATDNPWDGVAEKYSIGTSWESEIREISNKGVVVAVENVEGFLPRGRMGQEARRLPDMKVGEKLSVNVIDVDAKAMSLIFGLPMPERAERGEESEQRSSSERNGGERGGARREGGGRGDGGGRREGGGGRREGGRPGRGGGRNEQQAPKVGATDEMRSSQTVGSFSIGEMLSDVLKKQLNIETPEASAQESAPAEAPTATPNEAPSVTTAATATTVPSDTAGSNPDGAQSETVSEDVSGGSDSEQATS